MPVERSSRVRRALCFRQWQPSCTGSPTSCKSTTTICSPYTTPGTCPRLVLSLSAPLLPLETADQVNSCAFWFILVKSHQQPRISRYPVPWVGLVSLLCSTVTAINVRRLVTAPVARALFNNPCPLLLYPPLFQHLYRFLHRRAASVARPRRTRGQLCSTYITHYDPSHQHQAH